MTPRRSAPPSAAGSVAHRATRKILTKHKDKETAPQVKYSICSEEPDADTPALILFLLWLPALPRQRHASQPLDQTASLVAGSGMGEGVGPMVGPMTSSCTTRRRAANLVCDGELVASINTLLW